MGPSEEEWIARKEIIHQVYFQGTLPQLMEHMEKEYSFVAR